MEVNSIILVKKVRMVFELQAKMDGIASNI